MTGYDRAGRAAPARADPGSYPCRGRSSSGRSFSQRAAGFVVDQTGPDGPWVTHVFLRQVSERHMLLDIFDAEITPSGSGKVRQCEYSKHFAGNGDET